MDMLPGRGQNVHFDDKGRVEYTGDKTMFSLVRDILSTNQLLSNRFLVDADETNYEDLLGNERYGYQKAFDFKKQRS